MSLITDLDRLQFMDDVCPVMHASRVDGHGLIMIDVEDRRYARPTLSAAIDDAILAGEWKRTDGCVLAPPAPVNPTRTELELDDIDAALERLASPARFDLTFDGIEIAKRTESAAYILKKFRAWRRRRSGPLACFDCGRPLSGVPYRDDFLRAPQPDEQATNRPSDAR